MRIVGPPYLLVCEFDRSCNGRLLGEEFEECGECEREFELGFADEDMPKYGEKKSSTGRVYIQDFRGFQAAGDIKLRNKSVKTRDFE